MQVYYFLFLHCYSLILLPPVKSSVNLKWQASLILINLRGLVWCKKTCESSCLWKMFSIWLAVFLNGSYAYVVILTVNSTFSWKSWSKYPYAWQQQILFDYIWRCKTVISQYCFLSFLHYLPTSFLISNRFHMKG